MSIHSGAMSSYRNPIANAGVFLNLKVPSCCFRYSFPTCPAAPVTYRSSRLSPLASPQAMDAPSCDSLFGRRGL